MQYFSVGKLIQQDGIVGVLRKTSKFCEITYMLFSVLLLEKLKAIEALRFVLIALLHMLVEFVGLEFVVGVQRALDHFVTVKRLYEMLFHGREGELFFTAV